MDNQTIAAPFPAYPSVSRYVALGSIEEAVTRVCRSIDAHEAISLVMGPPGTGKSLICGLLVNHYRATHDVIVLGDTTIENRAAFLRHLLHHLGADYSSTPDNDLHLALVDRVCGPSAPQEGLLIVVDEAQSLAPEVLESIRMVTNIMRSGQPRVTAVVCGGMKLDELLIDSSLEPFVQRIATRCYLHPMNAHETRYYIHETIRGCGAEPAETITGEAIAAIHHATSGVPRLVNQMMTQAIDCAAEAETSLISEDIVDRAWSTLQQLPSPMIEQPKLRSSTATPIEFGELDMSPITSANKKKETAVALEPKASQNEMPDETLTLAEDDHWDLEEPALDFADIQVEASSSMWVDEADDEGVEKPAMNPTASELFGEFDLEEDIPVGNSSATAPAMSGVNDSESQVTDIESMLHQEIIGLSTFDDSAMLIIEPLDSELAASDSMPPEPMEIIGDEVDADEEKPHLLIIDNEDDAGARESIDLSHDDSDMLVIEDELELMRADAPNATNAAPRNVTIDFQSMLARMRTGS